MDIDNGPGGHLSAEQAAALLGVSARHVRRLIASGLLAGHERPYRTHRAAVDAYRQRQLGLDGDVVNGAQRTDISPDRGGHQSSKVDADVMAGAFTVAMAELARAREQVAALAREVGRLEAELAHCRPGQGRRGHANGQRAGALARLGPWLRR